LIGAEPGKSAARRNRDANAGKLPWFAALRGRVGLIEDSTWLLYGTGGIAIGGAVRGIVERRRDHHQD